MKKGLKITLIILGVLIGIILLDTLQAIVFNNSPLISIRKEYKDGYVPYINKGLLVNYYYCSNEEEKTVFKGTKFACKIDDNNKDNDYSNDEHSFFGKVIESHTTYLIVEPNENEDERKSSDKFRVELGKYNDAIYEVGSNVKITYEGMINESYPAQIGTTKIELKSADGFELTFYQAPGNVKKQIIDKKTSKKYDYNVYIWNGDVEIVINSKTYTLEDALNNNKITMDEIIAKANKDIPDAVSYDDGGSIEYHYTDYTIIKLHTLNGNRDVYIGTKNLKLNDIK